MSFVEKIFPKQERYAALLLYGMVFATCFNGYDAGIMTVILADRQFNEYYGITPARTGLVASIPWATTGIAQAFVGGTLASLVGRLWALRIAICVTIIGVVVQVIPNTFGVLIVGRLITGLGFGCTYIATSLYVSECAPTRLRGSFVGTVTQFGYQLGTLIAFWSGYGLSFHTSPYNIAWRVSNAIQIPIGILFILVSFLYPESPRWLLHKYPAQPARAAAVLSRLRGLDLEHERVAAELHEMISFREACAARREGTGFRAIFSQPALRKRLAYGVYVMALQQVGGIAAVTMFATLIYESLGWAAGAQALSINGIQAALQLAIVLVNTVTVDRFGRRALLVTGFALQAGALVVLAALTTRFADNESRPAAVVEVAMLFLVGLTYCCTNGPTTPAVAAEIFPQHVRDKAFGLSCLGQTACLLALVQSWPTLYAEAHGKSYWLLAGLNVAAMVSVLVILPETKGVSLERMDKLFGEADKVVVGEDVMQTAHGEAISVGVGSGAAAADTTKEPLSDDDDNNKSGSSHHEVTKIG